MFRLFSVTIRQVITQRGRCYQYQTTFLRVLHVFGSPGKDCLKQSGNLHPSVVSNSHHPSLCSSLKLCSDNEAENVIVTRNQSQQYTRTPVLSKRGSTKGRLDEQHEGTDTSARQCGIALTNTAIVAPQRHVTRSSASECTLLHETD